MTGLRATASSAWRPAVRRAGRATAFAIARVIVLAVAALTAAPARAEGPPALDVQDDAGRHWRFDQAPRRVVSLLPSLTESVWAIGAGDRLVGVDRYSNWPAALDALPRLGGLDDVQIESIVALKPDLVLASMAARSLDRLESLGLRVVRLQTLRHADVQRTLQLLGRLFQRPEAADRAWADIQRQLQDAATRVPAAWQGRLAVFEVGAGPYAAGRDSFIGETMHRLGLRNLVPPELGPFPRLNPEYIVRGAPELIIGSATDLVNLRARPGWDRIPAVQRGHTCLYPSAGYEVLVRPGPRLGEAAALIAECLRTLPP